MAAADRREAILEAALEVFSERGFGEAALEDVAAQGGISKALIYEHFESKRALQEALLDTYLRELIERVVGAITGATTDEDRLRAGIDAFLRFSADHPATLRLLTRNVSDPVAGEAIDRLREEAATALASIMAQDAPPPEPGDLDLEATVALVAHMISGGIQSMAGWWADHPEIPRERVLEIAMGVHWLGLERLGEGVRWSGAVDAGGRADDRGTRGRP
jgi:AcrR family transcriptional regulator